MRYFFFVALIVTLHATPAFSQECVQYDAGTQIATLTDDRIDEASGLSASWRNEGIFWVHNDSGDSPRVFAIDINGDTQTVLTLNAEAEDWEDIAVGPCARGDATPCVWVGDIGDNDEERDSIQLYRFEEPDLGVAPPATLEIDDVTTISVTYEGGPRNAETLLVHPIDGRVFIVDKTVGDPTNLWSVPTDGVTPASIVASTSFGEVGIVSGRVTGGDFAPDGQAFTIRTYHFVYTFCGPDPAAAFEAARSSVIGTTLFQSEAVTYTRDGSSVLTTTEVQSSEQPPLLRMRPVGMPMDPPPTTMDSGSPPPPVPSEKMDSGGRPPEMPNAGADVSITLINDYNKSSCSCGVQPGSFDMIGVLFVGLIGGRVFRRRSRARTGGVN